MSTNIERFSRWVEQLEAIQDPKERSFFLHVVNERTENGCVVRALESAFGVEATDEEWDIRINDMRQLENDLRPLKKMVEELGDPELRFKARITARAMDRKLIRSYTSRVAEHETPLGLALRRYDLTDTVLGSDVICQFMESGKILLVDIEKGKARHLVHVGIQDGETVSLNDDGQQIDFGVNNQFAVFVFTPIV